MDESLNQKSAADHYRTAMMHRACALAARVDKRGETNESALEKYTAHMREADLHVQLAQVRLTAVQALATRQAMLRADGDDLSVRQQGLINYELNVWAEHTGP